MPDLGMPEDDAAVRAAGRVKHPARLISVHKPRKETTMSKTNNQVAHDFYYLGVMEHKNKWYRGCSISYGERNCYSYSTLIAKVVPSKGHKVEDIDTSRPDTAVTLISYDSMSSTTGRHISGVNGASPFKTICVPMKFGSRDVYPFEFGKRFLERLEIEAKHLNRKEHRMEFLFLLKSRQRVIELACDEWSKSLKDKAFAKYEKMAKDLDGFAKKLQAEVRSKAAKAAKLTRDTLKKYLGSNPTGKAYVDLIQSAFCAWGQERALLMSDRERTVVRERLDTNKWAYVWIEGENLVTTKDVRVPVEQAKLAMRAWALGHDMRKFQVDRYQVLKYEGDTVKIGCHDIPRENMLALYEVLMGKPFQITKGE